MHSAIVLPVVSAVLLSVCAAGAGQPDRRDEFIRVSADGWHFETSESHTPFVPFGGVYYDLATYADKPFPRFLTITKFDEGRTDRHLAQIEGIGANLVRISLSTAVFSPEHKKLDEKAFRTLDRMIALARKHRLRVILDLCVEWEGRAEWSQPAWESFTDEKAIQGYEFLYSAIAERYKDEPTVFSYLLCDEYKIPWESKGMLAAWREWVKCKYPTEELDEAWQDYPLEGESREAVLAPRDENAPGSRRLYDYQTFREVVAERFVGRLAAAILSAEADRKHLISLGNVQWVAPLRVERVDSEVMKPSGYPAFNPQKVGRHLNYLHINSYDWWDDEDAKYTQALGRFTYVAGKPVVLGEFSFDPRVVEFTKGSFAGYCAWAFYPLPSEPSLNHLFDDNEKLTLHGLAFKQTAAKVKSGDLTFDRVKEEATLKVNAIDVWTDLHAADAAYARYMEMCTGRKVVGMKVEAQEETD